MKESNIGQTTVTVPLRKKDKLNKLKQEFTIAKIGCKIPLGVLMVEGMCYITDKMKEGKLRLEFDGANVTFSDLVEPKGEKKEEKPIGFVEGAIEISNRNKPKIERAKRRKKVVPDTEENKKAKRKAKKMIKALFVGTPLAKIN